VIVDVQIAKEDNMNDQSKCEHHYHASNMVYAKDSAGIPFRGGNWHAAAKYTVFVCGKCLDTKEVCIAPPLTVKPAAPFQQDKLSKAEQPKNKIRMHA
jgi:hypothetical protein